MAKVRVQIAKPGGIVWDEDQPDPKCRVMIEGREFTVDLTSRIAAKLSEGALVEVQETTAKEAGHPESGKIGPKDWPGREALQAMDWPDLKAWAKNQELTFPGNIGREVLLNLIDEHRQKAAE